MRTTSYLLILICLAGGLPACKVQKKNINYLSADVRDTSHMRIWQSYEARIQPGDRLTITVSALNPGSAQAYSLGLNGAPGVVTVDQEGNILYPQLGSIKAAGLTKSELRNALLNKLSIYLKDPIAAIDFANFKVTLLGEVGRQGIIDVPNGKITILEALGQSGGVSDVGQRDSVLVIREINGKRQFGIINLLSNETFKSEYFTLQQNDVVYVPLMEKKAFVSEKAEKPITFQTVTSILGIVTTIAFLILNFSRR